MRAVAHAWKRHCCGAFLASCAPLRLYDARTAASPALDLSRFGDAPRQKVVRGTGAILRALLELCLDPSSRLRTRGSSSRLPNLRPPLCATRDATGCRSLCSRVSTIALNAPKRLSPAETPRLHGRAATLAVLSLWCTLAGRRVRDTVAPRAATKSQHKP